ncbi:hypothetical protein BASA50_010076 [Batrachochytrium salamandrivorans]|uniref:VWFD domain-containing protein n=1 Tax=Batrachochytrium salamandrivorans TaxID=1357716 RepID=A0ABQ8EZK8_9FUNG|nr:hypothetical protein BASA50_010076 [Batrachochytrium salamandrivorans]
MLSRLIITFLYAAAIGSVSGAFLTFDPDPIVFKDIERPIRFSAKLNSKPTEEVTVYLQHRFMSMSTCMIVFNPDNWDVLQQITGVFAPLFVGSYDLPGQLASKTKLLAKAETNEVKTFDEISFSFNKPGWYKMVSTRDIEVQVFIDECTAGLPCIKKVLARYGSTAMGMDVSGPVKNINEYPPTYVTQNTNGLQYIPGPHGNHYKIDFPYGSVLNVVVLNNDGIMSLHVNLFLVAGYSSPGGFCNKIRDSSPDNRLIGSDGKSYTHEKENEVAAFVDSWRVKAKDVLTNPRARTLNLPARPGTVCKFPKNPPPKPTTTTVDLSKSTLYPTITYALSSTTITTSPSTTSTTSPYLPDPPAPGGYVRPPPPSPGGYVVDEIQRCFRPAGI